MWVVLFTSQRAREPYHIKALPWQHWAGGTQESEVGRTAFSDPLNINYLVKDEAQQYSQGKPCLMKKAVKFEERKTPHGAQHLVEKEMQMAQYKPGCKRETETLCCLEFSLVPVSFSALTYRSLICAPVHLQAKFIWAGASPGAFPQLSFSLWSACWGWLRHFWLMGGGRVCSRKQ